MIHLYILTGCLTACLAIVVSILIFCYQPIIKHLSEEIDDLNDIVGVHGKTLEDLTDLNVRDDIYVKLATLNNEIQRLKRK